MLEEDCIPRSFEVCSMRKKEMLEDPYKDEMTEVDFNGD
jgi:hypothetical protein